jgi:DNA-binding NarL/FixJ family response regulator
MKGNMIRVLIAEDHKLVREGLRALLRREADIQIVAEASDGLEALQQVAARHPDLVVMDAGLPGLSGIEATRRLKAVQPSLPVLILSMHDDAKTVDQALRAGARGYILKGLGVADLCQAIRTVHRGELYLSPQLAERTLPGFLSSDAEPVDPLSPREREVLQLIAEGYTSRQIAERLELSRRTVENHRTNIMSKLGIRTVAGLVRYALREGIVR